jgi:ketosteroid isomerase-like protein
VTSPAADPSAASAASVASDTDARAVHEALVKEVIALISAGRYDDMVGLLHDDLVFELPYGPEGFPPAFDKPTFTGMQQATFALFSSFSLELTELHRTLDADSLVAEYRSDAVVKATGAPYRNRYIGVFRFRDGRIVGWREFHNPEVANAALRPG